MNKIKFALIGCGAIAHKHILALNRINEAKVVGVYDNNPTVVESFAKKYSIPTFYNVEEMVEKSDPDVLNILTPSGCHADNILDLIQYEKHFVVEKPLALRLDQIDNILEKCENKLKIFIVQQNRFNSPIQQLKKALDMGRFGKLVLGTVRVRWCRDQRYYNQKDWRGTWANDGGVLTNQASHHIDMLIWMMGEVESVMAKTTTQLVDIEAEDTGVAILKFRNGALGIIEATTATRPKDLEGSISILGENGSVEIAGFFMNELKTWNFKNSNKMDDVVWKKYAKVPEDRAWNHTEFLKDVVYSIKYNTKGLVDGLEGRKSVELINAIYESVEREEQVHLRFSPKKCKLGV